MSASLLANSFVPMGPKRKRKKSILSAFIVAQQQSGQSNAAALLAELIQLHSKQTGGKKKPSGLNPVKKPCQKCQSALPSCLHFRCWGQVSQSLRDVGVGTLKVGEVLKRMALAVACFRSDKREREPVLHLHHRLKSNLVRVT